MSPQHTDNDIALPHAALLAYFRHSPALPRISDAEPSPPPYERCDFVHGSLLPNAIDSNNDNEESNSGFWGERNSFDHERKGTQEVAPLELKKTRYRGVYAFCCFWCAISICILAAFGVFFALDVVFTQFGMGTGLTKWMTHRNLGQNGTDYKASRTPGTSSNGIKFSTNII